MSRTQKILMCAPDYFGVEYEINPWMEGNVGRTDYAVARQQWQNLHDQIARHTEVVLLPPQPKLPDMVFTANAGLVVGNKAIVSRFRSTERQGEEPYFRDFFAAAGFMLGDWPQEIFFEGAGDALFDRGSATDGEIFLWAGHGFRSAPEAAPRVAKFINRRVESLRLVDPRWYHLDTCFCPLSGGSIMYYPNAFAPESQALIKQLVPANKLIAIGESDALGYACNAVDIDNHLFLNTASPELQAQLRAIGLTPMITPLGEYLKSGGAAKCLTLKLLED